MQNEDVRQYRKFREAQDNLEEANSHWQAPLRVAVSGLHRFGAYYRAILQRERTSYPDQRDGAALRIGVLINAAWKLGGDFAYALDRGEVRALPGEPLDLDPFNGTKVATLDNQPSSLRK